MQHSHRLRAALTLWPTQVNKSPESNVRRFYRLQHRRASSDLIELNREGERLHRRKHIQPPFPSKDAQSEEGDGGWTRWSRRYSGFNGQQVNRHQKTTGVRRHSASWIKEEQTRTLARGQQPITLTDTACYPKSRTSIRSTKTLRNYKNKHNQIRINTPLHSTLKNQSRPSPCIQDHTLAAVGERLDWVRGVGRTGEEKEELQNEEEEEEPKKNNKTKRGAKAKI